MAGDETWTATDVAKYFKVTPQAIRAAEERGDIPASFRINRGNVAVRHWTLDQIPEIGKQFGFLKRPHKQLVLPIFTVKGGVLKTSICYNLARTLAINGIKTLIIGQESNQSSITKICLPPQEVKSIKEYKRVPSLYHFFFENIPLKDIIRTTDLPTLDIIPETAELSALAKKLQNERKREEYYINKLLPDEAIKKYDVILFDNGANFNILVENSLACADSVISPIGCDLLAYEAVETNFQQIFEFRNDMKLKWKDIIIIPTLLGNNNISQQIFATYLLEFSEGITKTPIKRFDAIGQESIFFRRSVPEHKPGSELAEEYLQIIQEIWQRVNGDLIS